MPLNKQILEIKDNSCWKVLIKVNITLRKLVQKLIEPYFLLQLKLTNKVKVERVGRQ